MRKMTNFTTVDESLSYTKGKKGQCIRQAEMLAAKSLRKQNALGEMSGSKRESMSIIVSSSIWS